jgi:predicted small lipoprotein YifL
MLRLMTMNRAAVLLLLALAGCGQGGAGQAASDAPVARVQLAHEPRPEDRELHLLVQELECASGHSAEGRIAPPEVEYQEDKVVVTMRVERRSNDEDCNGGPATPYALELEEPLGERALLDGSRNPATPVEVIAR